VAMITEAKSAVNETSRLQWPDLSKDQRAWELAKVALGTDAPISAIAKRAQEIKETL
jgi:hypothetical protein